MGRSIFINYRRDDSAANALSIAQYLQRKFGEGNVFLDIEQIHAGAEFPSVLKSTLNNCKIMLVVIGPTWASIADKDGKPRIVNREDWVRKEIVFALAKGILVIPVLVRGAILPDKSLLPEELWPLLERQAVTLTINGFRTEMAGLTHDLRAIVAYPRTWLLVAGAGAASFAVIGYLLAAGNVADRCQGLPGETAWIYAGPYDALQARFKAPPTFKISNQDRDAAYVEPGDWIELLQPRRTMILDYAKTGTDRALDSPFLLNGKINYTCKNLNAGDKVYVADKKVNGPTASDNHVWLRVRAGPPG